jgi:hypothetical protein
MRSSRGTVALLSATFESTIQDQWTETVSTVQVLSDTRKRLNNRPTLVE